MQENLKQKALNYFQNNINYIEQNHPKVFTKLAALDTALNTKEYVNKYEILIEDANYFDVLELSTGKKLYGSNSNLYAKTVAKTINFDKHTNLYKTFREHPLDIKDTKDITPLLSYIKSHSPENKEIIHLKKFIFFGTGLGIHITSVHEKIMAQSYLIIEEDLELFKLSLFCTPYYLIAMRSNIIFSIFEDESEFDFTAQNFLNHHFYYNHYIKYFEMLNFPEKKLRDFHLKVVSQSQNIFFYNSILEQYLLPLEYIQQEYNFLNLLHYDEESPLHTTPTLLLGAGPSLSKHIELISKYQDCFIIIGVSSTLLTLSKYNITPDIIVHMDGFEEGVKHFTNLPSKDFLKNTLFFLSARSPKSLVESIQKEKIFFYENGSFYKKSMGNLSAACVGSTTYLLSLALGVKELYLLGLDLALEQTKGTTHAQEHTFGQKLKLDITNHDDVMDFKTSLVKTKGNFQESVITTNEYTFSIESINAASMGFKHDTQKVYNLSDGAGFNNVTPLHIEEMILDKYPHYTKEVLKNNLFKTFKKHASSQLTQQEQSLIEKKRQHIYKLLEKVQEYSLQQAQTVEEFYKRLIEIFEIFSQKNEDDFSDISLVLQEYFKYTYTFIFDFCNSQTLDTLHHLPILQEHFLSALKNILQKYIVSLNKI